MMLTEFIERTNYPATADEYHYIEESYCNYNGNKDDFCKAWLKDKKSGAWARELELRKRMHAMVEQHKKEMAEKEENLKFYREQHAVQRNEIKELKEDAQEWIKRFDELKKQADERELAARKDVTITLKNGEQVNTGFAEVRYINNNGFCFANVVEQSGWTTSYKMDDIAGITIA